MTHREQTQFIKEVSMIKTLVILSAIAFSSAYSADAFDVAAYYTKNCVLCHGKNGQGNAGMKSPKLAGQLSVYVVKALKDYKDNKRTNAPLMKPIVAALDDTKINALATYIEKQLK